MNQHLPYESLIAQKMEQLPVPDRSAAIWADVLQQLDTPLPAADNNIPKQKGVPKKWIWVTVGVSCLIIVVLYFLLAKPKKSVPQRTQPIPQNVIPQQPPVITPDTVHTDNLKSLTPLPRNKTALPVTIIHNDSIPAATLPPPIVIAPPVRQDSIKPIKSDVVIPPAPAPGKNRFSGVKGIGDSSYRISNKKDSGR